jgi:CHASE3 domain sensor protein
MYGVGLTFNGAIILFFILVAVFFSIIIMGSMVTPEDSNNRIEEINENENGEDNKKEV